MSSADIGALALALMLVIGLANVSGFVFVRLGQPRIVGEIAAGILLGPTVLGRFAPETASWFGAAGGRANDVFGFLYELGLLLLMFVSGAAARRVLAKENRAATAWLLTVGTALPFLAGLAFAAWMPMGSLIGPEGTRSSVALIVAIAVSVTSIPVLSHIFASMGIMHTRFASIVLGVAVLEDILLWGVLAFATALAASDATGAVSGEIAAHVGTTFAFLAAGLWVFPRLLVRLARARWNVLVRQSPIAWAMTVMLCFVGVAGLLGVTPAFAAFLAGFGIVGGMGAIDRARFAEPIDLIGRFAFATFIPLYTAMIGYRLDFSRSFSLAAFVVFLAGSSALRGTFAALASRLAGFRGSDALNLAVTINARGGPGIVLASIAFDAGIISASFFTTLVVTAIVTSQGAGWWIARALRRGRPLLAGEDVDHPHAEGSPAARASVGAA